MGLPPLGALGHLLARQGGHGGVLFDVRQLRECVQSHFKIIEKTIVFIAFLSIGVIWNLSGGGPGQRLGVLERRSLALTSLKERTPAYTFGFGKRPKRANAC